MRKILLTLFSLFAVVSVYGQGPAKWSFDQKDNGDGTYDLIFKATIPQPWYMYSTKPISDGPQPTTFTFKSKGGYEAVGKLKETTKPEKKMDPSFGIEVEVFHNNATFVQKIKKTSADPVKITGELEFQCCNGKECSMDFKDVTFNITGKAAGATPTTVPATTGKDSSAALPPADSAASVTPATDSAVATVAPATTETAPVNPTEDSSLLYFLLLAFAAGLGSVFTPCVFPMIPMTVSFFIGGGGNKKNGIMKGIIFGISVTLIYTLVGVLVSLFKSTSATDAMGTHWLPNLIFGVLFILFAISFFGAFEITLPSGLANKADSKADKGDISHLSLLLLQWLSYHFPARDLLSEQSWERQ